MHAVVVRSTLHDVDTALSSLQATVIPRVKQAPGFVSAQWVRLDESSGTSMLTFETEEAARTVVEMIKASPPDGVTVDSAVVGEVVARV